MAARKQLEGHAPAVLDELVARCRQAECSRADEADAAVILQSAWRGKSLRLELQRVTAAACCIQRCWRGYQGRQHAADVRKQHNAAMRQAYFDHHATTIQRWWRGHYSRTRLHSFAQRKAFLADVAAKNAAIRAALAEEAAAAAQLQQEQAVSAAMSSFEQQVRSNHHLASTACMPGVFSPPTAAVTGVPLVGGYTIEEHLRAAAKAQVQASLKLPRIHRQQHQDTAQAATSSSSSSSSSSPVRGRPGQLQGSNLRGSSSSPVRSGSKAAPAAPGATRWDSSNCKGSIGGAPSAASGKLVPTGTRTTLRQQAAYDAVKQARVLETRVDRAQMLVTHDGQPWVNPASRLNKPFLETQTVANCDPYIEPLPALGLLHTVTYSTPLRVTSAGTVRPASVRAELIRSPGLDDVAAIISPKAFDPHLRKQPFFDQDVVQGY